VVCAASLLALLLLAAAPARAELPAAEFGYDLDQGAFVRTKDRAWELNPYAMVQLQHVTLFDKGDVQSTTFSLRAAKFIFHGHIFHPSLTYHFQVNAGDGKVAAEDIYLRWDPWRSLGLLAGQIEVPFNRQHITLEAYQQLIDRSIVDQRFNLQRDLGAAVYAADPEHRFEATLGVWNGARQNVPNDDKSFLGTLRLAYNPWGPILFREADLDDSRAPRLSVAAAGAYNPSRVIPDSTGSGASVTWNHIVQGVAEVTFRYRGLSLSTETHVRHYALDSGAQKTDYGAFGQIGFFVIPRHLELQGRFAGIAGSLGAKDVTQELTGGAAYYFRGHRLKLQADYSMLEMRDHTVDHRVRTQLEFFL
jgi:hypothetical protein